jgi:hypothetical protein
VYGAAMCSRGVFVHCPSCLGSAAAVLSAEVHCRDGVFATLACERGQAIHHFDGVMSHSFKSSPLSGYDSEPKLLRVESRSNPCACGASQSIPVPPLFKALSWESVASECLRHFRCYVNCYSIGLRKWVGHHFKLLAVEPNAPSLPQSQDA